jgi:hypothetical protein
MKKPLAVIVPVYKEKLNQEEQISVEICGKKMSEYDLYFIMPRNLSDEEYSQYSNFHVRRFPDKYFKSTSTYNKLMLDTHFCEAFLEYEYLLIAQTDTLILDEAEKFKTFLQSGYDYIGAPWEEKEQFYFYTTKKFLYMYFHLGKEVLARVGNGGFSLRRIDKTIALLKEKSFWKIFWRGNEDFFFACYGEDNQCGFRLASTEIARKFALETDMREHLENHEQPFAVHKWQNDFKTYEEIKSYVKC